MTSVRGALIRRGVDREVSRAGARLRRGRFEVEDPVAADRLRYRRLDRQPCSLAGISSS